MSNVYCCGYGLFGFLGLGFLRLVQHRDLFGHLFGSGLPLGGSSLGGGFFDKHLFGSFKGFFRGFFGGF